MKERRTDILCQKKRPFSLTYFCIELHVIINRLKNTMLMKKTYLLPNTDSVEGIMMIGSICEATQFSGEKDFKDYDPAEPPI